MWLTLYQARQRGRIIYWHLITMQPNTSVSELKAGELCMVAMKTVAAEETSKHLALNKIIRETCTLQVKSDWGKSLYTVGRLHVTPGKSRRIDWTQHHRYCLWQHGLKITG
jgi:hypothetical protein